MQLEGYSQLDILSEGGMSTVYRARQASSQREVAIKFLSGDFVLDDENRGWFERETAVIARLNHPNIAPIIDFGVNQDGRPYFVMPYIEGRKLAVHREQSQPTLSQGIHLMIQVARGLSFAHRNGVVHRDLSPDNVLVSDNGRVYILNFGVAWLETHGRADADTVPGTPQYLSPEQSRDPLHIGPLSDIYSLGALMCEFFSSASGDANGDTPRKSLQGLPKPLVAVILRCLAPEPGRRPASACRVALRLLRLLHADHIMPNEKAEAYATVGRQTGRFELLEVIRHNQYGSIYLFNDRDDNRLLVAKKRMSTHAGLRQARHLKNVHYKNIVNILGVSNKRDTFVVLMEYLSGGSLQERLARPWPVADFLPLALEVCYAMQKAHDEGIVHGNLRPSNILFDDSGHVRVSDFGFSKHYIGNDQRDWYQPQSRLDASVQRDIYSAGVIFHHMLTARLPLVRYSLLVSDKEFESLDSSLQTLVRGMIEMQSVNRYTSFRDIIGVLQDLSLGVRPRLLRRAEPPGERRWKRRLSLLLALLAAAGAGFLLLKG